MRFGVGRGVMREDSNFTWVKPHFSLPLLSYLRLVFRPSPLLLVHLLRSLLLSYSMKISSLFLGVGSNSAFRWEIHLGFWHFWGVFGPMSLRAKQHLFSWIRNGCVSPESNACSETLPLFLSSWLFSHQFLIRIFLSPVPMEGTIGLAASFYSIC